MNTDKRKWVWKIKFRRLLILVLAHILFNATATIALNAQDRASGKSHLTPYTISKETTYLTEPLRKDGSVDYVAALNWRFSQGVTPENNAAVLFWKAVGPKEILPEHRDKYFQMLGIPPLPEQGDYFVSLDNYVAGRKKSTESTSAEQKHETLADINKQFELAIGRPWSQQEFPVLAEWLAANEKPLVLIVEASKRPRRYDPLCCEENTPLIGVYLPAFQESVRYVLGQCCVSKETNWRTPGKIC